MSKCIGWDIGIKNLAYCVLDSKILETNVTPDTICFNKNYYNIVNWHDISLVSQIEMNMEEGGEVSHINNTLKCSATQVKKNNKINNKKNNKKDKKHGEEPESELEPVSENIICGKTAMYCKEELTTDSSGNTSYFGLCKTHFKKAGISPLPELNVKKCWAPECNGKPIQVLKAHIYKGYCKKHINDMIKEKTHLVNDFLKINRAKTTSKFDINQLGIALFQELDKIKEKVLDASTILLENQPVLKNPTMKSIQMFLYSYYLLRILESSSRSDGTGTGTGTVSSSSSTSRPINVLNNKKIQCYCASKKLDLIIFLPETEQVRINEVIEKVNSGYQKNKKMAIMMVETLLQNNPKWLSFFKGHPKQDDLADSLLMTLHYFEKANLLKIKTDDKKKELKKIKEDKKIDKKKFEQKDEDADEDADDNEDNEDN